MVGPANGVSNNLALEKINCMLIVRIRAFRQPELQGHKTITSQMAGVGGSRAPQHHPLATPLFFKPHDSCEWGP